MSKTASIISFTTLANQTSFVNGVNSNFAAINLALQNTLSLDGSTPNAMKASLNVNNWPIIGLPTPVNPTDALRLQDINGVLGLLSATSPDQQISGGARILCYNLGYAYVGNNITVDPGNGPLQYIINSGAFTLTAPNYDGSLVLSVSNGSGAGTITFSGFNVGSNTGDIYTTTTNNVYFIYITRIAGRSSYTIKATQ